MEALTTSLGEWMWNPSFFHFLRYRRFPGGREKWPEPRKSRRREQGEVKGESEVEDESRERDWDFAEKIITIYKDEDEEEDETSKCVFVCVF